MRKLNTALALRLRKGSVIKTDKADGVIPSTLGMPKGWKTLTAQHGQFVMNSSSPVKRKVFYHLSFAK